MNRSERAALAQQTLAILEAGRYDLPDGSTVTIESDIARCLAGTRLFEPAELARLRERQAGSPAQTLRGEIEVANETTLSGIARLVREGRGPVAALNFASAKNPGGGFLSGSQAQEESLARSSALHASLVKQGDFYERHRQQPHPLYSDAMILSPDCPIFRDDAGALLESVHHVTFITSPAPNAGALKDHYPQDVASIPETFERRAAYVLALAAFAGCRNLVLGAWGCGVFRNDPALVAGVFMKHLRSGEWAGVFSRVVFSIFDPAPGAPIVEVFRQASGR
jgi:uncharacterized protein (TIGR02452 family)